MTDNKVFYAGITVGPIVSTISMTNSPAGIWCASGLFSCISEGLCKAIYTNPAFSTINGKIINPYFTEDELKANVFKIQKTGIGCYHDRIYIKADAVSDKDILKEILDNAIGSVINDIGGKIAGTIEEKEKDMIAFLKKYLQIHYVIHEGDITENCILTLSPYLDSLELMPTYSGKASKNLLLKLFEGESSVTKNKYVKDCFMVEKTALQLLKGKSVRDIKDIARFALHGKCNITETESETIAEEETETTTEGENEVTTEKKNTKPKLKRHNYFAVVQADGDGIGNILKNAVGSNLASLELFSKTCLEYTTEAAKLIGDFGGMTIYAGGDDLLFLAPVENGKETGQTRTIFDLCKKIRTKFCEKFEGFENALKEQDSTFEGFETFPSVSFGISINYYKYPLREAFEEARGLLFGNAKNHESLKTDKVSSPKFKKNSTAVILRKASGQMGKFVFFHDGAFETQMTTLLEESLDASDKAHDTLHSVMFHLRCGKKYTQAAYTANNNEFSTYEVIINNATDLKAAFDHLFDSDSHNVSRAYIDKIRNIYESLRQSKEEGNESEGFNPFDSLNQMLWMIKFFTEKAGKENE